MGSTKAKIARECPRSMARLTLLPSVRQGTELFLPRSSYQNRSTESLPFAFDAQGSP